MVYFKRINATRHYKEEHEREVPWDKVVELIFTTKNPRKKGLTFEIESENYYVVFKIEKDILWVINAKRSK